jgi:hypothetical protein
MGNPPPTLLRQWASAVAWGYVGQDEGQAPPGRGEKFRFPSLKGPGMGNAWSKSVVKEKA